MPNHSCICLIRPTCLRCCGLMLPGPALRRQKCALGVSQRLFTACRRRRTSGCYPVTALFFFFLRSEASCAPTFCETTKAHVSTGFKLMGCSRWICREVVQSFAPACLPPTLTTTTTTLPQHGDQTVPRGRHKRIPKCYLPREATGRLPDKEPLFSFLFDSHFLGLYRAVLFFLLFEKT